MNYDGREAEIVSWQGMASGIGKRESCVGRQTPYLGVGITKRTLVRFCGLLEPRSNIDQKHCIRSRVYLTEINTDAVEDFVAPLQMP